MSTSKVKQVLHLIDDAGLGGVMRVLVDQLPRLSAGCEHEIRHVDARWRLPSTLQADVVVVHFTLSWSKLPFLAALRRRAGGARIVLVEHSYTEAYERLRVPSRGRFRAMLRLAYAAADRVVAVSHAQGSWIRAAKLARWGRLVEIPQACDTSVLAELPALASGRNGPLRLGAYGRYAPQKGFDTLITAMRQIPPEVATLRLAGYGPDQAALEALAQGLPHVQIGGPIDGPAGFLAEIDAVVIPSRWEAYGLVAAESRAAGRPVLAAGTDGLREQVSPECGALFAADDPAALAGAVRDLASRDLVAMGAACRRSVRGALDTTVAQWDELFRGLGLSCAAKAA